MINTIFYEHLIQAYCSEAQHYISLINKKYSLDEIWDRKTKKIPRTELLIPKEDVFYSFHGSGCAILTGDPNECKDKGVIDFDFSDYQEGGGIKFDSWKIAYYLENKIEGLKIYDDSTIKKILTSLVEKNFLKKDGNQFCLKKLK